MTNTTIEANGTDEMLDDCLRRFPSARLPLALTI